MDDTTRQKALNWMRQQAQTVPDEGLSRFWQAMRFTEKWEGFFSNDKADPGGKTKYGISDAGDGTIDGMIDLDRDGKGDVKVEELTQGQAIEYLHRWYWQASGAASLPWPYAAVIFDTAVNCGVGRALQWDRESKGNSKQFLIRRMDYYLALCEKHPKLRKYRNGWVNRVVDLRKFVEAELNRAI